MISYLWVISSMYQKCPRYIQLSYLKILSNIVSCDVGRKCYIISILQVVELKFYGMIFIQLSHGTLGSNTVFVLLHLTQCTTLKIVHVHTHYIFFIHPSIDAYLGCFHILYIMQWIQRHIYLFKLVFSFWIRRRRWHPTSVLLPGKSHGRRSLIGCSPWGPEESVTTERLHFHFSLSCIGEGNGNPLWCSGPENPRDGGVWWAAVYGVAQSQT